MGSDHIEIKIISEEIIKPSSPTSETLRDRKFSFLDQIVVTCYIPFIFFYQNAYSSNHSQISRQLKQSLSDALTKFYTFSGRINGNTSILCDDSGALFVEARVHTSLSQALKKGISDNLNKYLHIEPYSDGSSKDITRNIPLIVKVNFFDCGGIAIGVCISHKLGDLSNSIDFMNVWAKIHREETGIGNPNLDLGCHYFPSLENIPQSYVVLVDNLVMKRFVFDKEKIAEIKNLISSAANSTLQNPTRVEAVSTFIWKHIIDVARNKDNTKTTFVLSHAVNLRPRISPPLPDPIIGGNFSVMEHGIFGQEMNDEDLAKVVRNCIRNIDHELPKIIKNGSGYYCNKLQESMKWLSDPDSGLCFFSSWCKFPLYEVDYGWGKPVCVGTVAMPIKNGVNLMDTKCGDGIEAWITMLEDEMAMLPNEFLSLENNDLYP